MVAAITAAVQWLARPAPTSWTRCMAGASAGAGGTSRAAAAGRPGRALTVYVDDWRQPATFDRADRWSHLLADDPEELHAWRQLGIPRRGYQRHRRSPR